MNRGRVSMAGMRSIWVKPMSRRHCGGLDVDVVQRLDMLRDEADRGDDDPRKAVVMECAQGGGQIRPEPVATAHALALKSDANGSLGPALQGVADGRSHCSKLRFVRIAGLDDAYRERVCRQDEGAVVAAVIADARPSLADGLGEGGDQIGLLAPAFGGDDGHRGRAIALDDGVVDVRGLGREGQ